MNTTHKLLAVIAVVLTIGLLQQLTTILVPLLVALFASLVMRPVQVGLQRRLPTWLGGLGTFIAAAIPVGIVLGAIGGLLLALRAIAPNWTEVETWATDLRTRATTMGDAWGVPMPASLSALPTELVSKVGEAISSAGVSAMGFLLASFFMLLILGDADAMARRVRAYGGRSAARRFVEATSTIGQKIRVFIMMRALAGLISGTSSTVLLLLLGVDYALLWGLLVLLLNFIPNLGSLIASVPPILLATLQHGPLRGLAVAGGIFVIEQIVGNFIDPRLQGHKLRLSPVIVLVVVVFASWLWGIGGTVLAVPCLILILVTMEQLPALAPLAGLFREDGDSAPLVDDADVDEEQLPSAT